MARAACVLLGFALGAVFGYWLTPAPEAGPRSPRPRASMAPAPEPERPVAPESEETPVPTGNGTIRGRVLDEHAAPIAGALVVAVPRRPGRGVRRREAGAVPWQEATLGKSVAALRWYERTRRTARTDAEGRYELSGLGASPHDLRAYREGYKFRRAAGQPRGDVTADATIDFAGQRYVLVGIDVLTSGEVPNVRLTLHGPEGSIRPWSPTSPWVELRPGTYEIHATGGDRLEYTSEKRTVRVESDKTPERVVLNLTGKPGLRVQVKLPEGFTARQISVRYLRFVGADPPGPAALRDNGKSARSGSDQEFWIPDLGAGRYLVGVHHGSFAFTATSVAEVGQGIGDVLLDVPRPDPARFIAVRALRPDGRVDRDASVTVEIRTEGMSLSGGGVTLRGPDGTMYSAYPRWDAAERGALPADARYFATVGTRDLGRRKVEFERQPGASIEVPFAEAATLRVAVRDYATSEHRETLRISLHRPDRGWSEWRQPLTPEGVREFGPIQPGSHRVVLAKTAGRAHSWPIAYEDVDVVSGKNEFLVTIPRLYTLEVEKETPKPGVWLTLAGGTAIERFSVHRGVPADGIVHFPDIAAGAYRLYCEDTEYKVTVPHRGRFRIR